MHQKENLQVQICRNLTFQTRYTLENIRKYIEKKLKTRFHLYVLTISFLHAKLIVTNFFKHSQIMRKN